MQFRKALLMTSSSGGASALVAAGGRVLARRLGGPAVRGAVRMMAGSASAPYTLYDIPVSNNGARVRMILYYKEVPSEVVEIKSPIKEFGGLATEGYQAVNPQKKMPALACRDEGLVIPESDTIARFVGGKFGEGGVGEFNPPAGSTLALRADRIARHHDIYLAPIQSCMYRAQVAAFLPCGTREDALAEFVRQLGILEDYADEGGPYLCGAAPTHADAACFPTLIFAAKMLPKFEGFDFAPGPRLERYMAYMTGNDDPVAARIYGEVRGALDGWDAKGRWESIRGAGLRDAAPETVFDAIIAKKIPAKVVFEDDRCVAFADIAPAAPVHVVLIPKRRSGLTQLRFATEEHTFQLGDLMAKIPKVAEAACLEDYRVVINDGAQAGQTVFHLHIHLLGGRPLSWPPG